MSVVLLHKYEHVYVPVYLCCDLMYSVHCAQSHQLAIIRLQRNGYCLTCLLNFIVRTIKRKMNPHFRAEMANFRDPIPVSAIKWKLLFTYSSGLINYSLTCASAMSQ